MRINDPVIKALVVLKTLIAYKFREKSEII